MALLSQLDKVKITTEIGTKLQSMNIQNSGSITITVALTAGSTTESTVTDNKWTISAQ